MDTNHFGHTLRQLRKSANMTQRDLANALNCSNQYVSLLETGKRPPPQPPELERFATALGAPLETLVVAATRTRGVTQFLLPPDTSPEAALVAVRLAEAWPTLPDWAVSAIGEVLRKATSTDGCAQDAEH